MAFISACGIAPEDDDANLAARSPAKAAPRVTPKVAEETRPARPIEELAPLIAGCETLTALQILWAGLTAEEKNAAKEMFSVRKGEFAK